MQGHPVAEQILQWMVDVSGLPVSLISQLYRMGPVVEDDSHASAPEQASDEVSVTGEWSAGR
jgi:hypothetical protein